MRTNYATLAIGTMLRLVGLAFIIIWSLGPILVVVLASFKEPKGIFEVPFRFIFTPTLENYEALAKNNPQFFTALLNSFIITAGAATVALIASFCAGYAFARAQRRGFARVAFLMLLFRMLPPIVVTIPLFPLINQLSLNDSHVILIVLYAAFYVSLGSWMMRSFVMQVPIELEEAADIDGASFIQILRRVVLPLTAQGLVAVTLFVVVFAWNEYLFALIFTTQHARTAPMIIGELLSTAEGVQWGEVFAASSIQLLPVLALVFALQRFLVAGLTAGAVKS